MARQIISVGEMQELVIFFIKPSQLKALDFSKVIYNWDCH